MRVLIILAAAFLTALLMRFKSKYRLEIFFGFILIVCAASIYLNITTLKNIVSFYRPYKQAFYQEEFLKEGQFPDALLVNVFKGKKVYTKNDPYYLAMAESEGKSFHYAFYHKANAQNFIEFSGGIVTEDDSMNGTMISADDIISDFEDLGYANDMFRYTFMHNSYDEEMGNYFTYYWYYYEYLKEIHVYVLSNTEYGNVFDSDELVFLWDSPKDKEEENFYLCTKAYYDAKVRNVNE